MAMDYTTSYAAIVKFEKNDDGTAYVYGKATDDTLDLDSQICDPKWLDTAMPRWFKSGGNVREMHGPSAAGIAKEYEAKTDGHYIGVHVVDAMAVKKCETGVYQGFSIGIKSPRVIQDTKAANGRIIDGQIIEVSLVDRPANPSAKLILAKTVDGEPTLVQVEESIEKHGDHDQSDHGGGGGGGDSKPSEGGRQTTDNRDRPFGDKQLEGAYKDTGKVMTDLQTYGANAASNPDFEKETGVPAEEVQSAINEAYGHLESAFSDISDANGADPEKSEALLSRAEDNLNEATRILETGPTTALENFARDIDSIAQDVMMNYTGGEKSLTTKKESKMRKINRITELAKSLTTVDAAKFDKSLFDNARKALAELIAAEALEMREGHDERHSLAALAGAVEALMAWYEGERHEGEVMEIEEVIEAKSADMPAEDEETKADMPNCEDGKCGKCAECMSEKAPSVPDTTEEEASDEAPTTMERDDEDKKKSADAEEVKEDSVAEVTDTPVEESADVPAVAEVIAEAVEEAVKSAMKSVEAKIVALQADKEAAVTKAVSLETELKDALNKAVAGGPKRTATDMPDNTKNDALVKAATLKAKMDATTDPLLYKGYMELRDAELAKASVITK